MVPSGGAAGTDKSVMNSRNDDDEDIKLRVEEETSSRKFHIGDTVMLVSLDDQRWYAHLVDLYEDLTMTDEISLSPQRMRCSLRWFYSYDDIFDGLRDADRDIKHDRTLYFSDHCDTGLNSIYAIRALVWVFPSFE